MFSDPIISDYHLIAQLYTCDGLIATLCAVPMAMVIRGYGYGYCYGNERGVIKTANCMEDT